MYAKIFFTVLKQFSRNLLEIRKRKPVNNILCIIYDLKQYYLLKTIPTIEAFLLHQNILIESIMIGS